MPFTISHWVFVKEAFDLPYAPTTAALYAKPFALALVNVSCPTVPKPKLVLVAFIVLGSIPWTNSPFTNAWQALDMLLPTKNGSSTKAEIILSTLKTVNESSLILPSLDCTMDDIWEGKE